MFSLPGGDALNAPLENATKLAAWPSDAQSEALAADAGRSARNAAAAADADHREPESDPPTRQSGTHAAASLAPTAARDVTRNG